MAQSVKLDLSREWLLDTIHDNPAVIDGMSEGELDWALALLGIDVAPVVAFVRDASCSIQNECADQQAPSVRVASDGDRPFAEDNSAVFQLLDQIQTRDVDTLSEAELDDSLATLNVDVSSVLRTISDTPPDSDVGPTGAGGDLVDTPSGDDHSWGLFAGISNCAMHSYRYDRGGIATGISLTLSSTVNPELATRITPVLATAVASTSMGFCSTLDVVACPGPSPTWASLSASTEGLALSWNVTGSGSPGRLQFGDASGTADMAAVVLGAGISISPMVSIGALVDGIGSSVSVNGSNDTITSGCGSLTVNAGTAGDLLVFGCSNEPGMDFVGGSGPFSVNGSNDTITSGCGSLTVNAGAASDLLVFGCSDELGMDFFGGSGRTTLVVIGEGSNNVIFDEPDWTAINALHGSCGDGTIAFGSDADFSTSSSSYAPKLLGSRVRDHLFAEGMRTRLPKAGVAVGAFFDYTSVANIVALIKSPNGGPGWRNKGERHALLHSQTRAGKTHFLHSNMLSAEGYSIVGRDPKGELATIVTDHHRTVGDVAALDLVRLLGVKTAVFDPLTALNPQVDMLADDTRELGEAIIKIEHGMHQLCFLLTTLLMRDCEKVARHAVSKNISDVLAPHNTVLRALTHSLGRLQGATWNAALNSEGGCVASAGIDGTIRLWETASGVVNLEVGCSTFGAPFKTVRDFYANGVGPLRFKKVPLGMEAGTQPTAMVSRVGGLEFGFCSHSGPVHLVWQSLGHATETQRSTSRPAVMSDWREPAVTDGNVLGGGDYGDVPHWRRFP